MACPRFMTAQSLKPICLHTALRRSVQYMRSSRNALSHLYAPRLPHKTQHRAPGECSKRNESLNPILWSNQSRRLHENAWPTMPKQGYYAVHTGMKPGIYLSWPDAEAQVKGYPNAKYKKFPTESAAKAYLAGGPSDPYITPTGDRASEPGPSRHRPSVIASSPVSVPVQPSPRPKSASNAFASSPPLSTPIDQLPDHLRPIAAQGYTFSRHNRLVVYADGSGLGNGKVGARAGAGVYWGKEGEAGKRNLSERVPGEVQTNNRGEILAVIRALEECPSPDLPLEICTDSQYTIRCTPGGKVADRGGMTEYLPKWLKNGFRPSLKNKPTSSSSAGGADQLGQVKNVDMIKHLLAVLRRRNPKAVVVFRYVPGHVGLEGNEAADRLAKQGAMKPVAPSRTWLNPEDEDGDHRAGRIEGKAGSVPFNIEIDETWLMSPEELQELEKEFEED